MKNLLNLMCLCMACLAGSGMAAGPAMAADAAASTPINEIDKPHKAFLSPHGGRLEVSVEKEVIHEAGADRVEFIIPQDATNLQLNVPGRTIARWESTPVPLQISSQHATNRGHAEKRQQNLNAQLATVKARIALWQAQLPEESGQNLAHRQTLMQQSMPELVLQQEQLQAQLELVNEELALMPKPRGVGSKISVILEPGREHGKNVKLIFSYDITSCGWDAVYDFDAHPDQNRGDKVDVRLLAEVWQYTGIDWSDTEITLATSGDGPREPQRLPEWIVGSATPVPQPRAVKAGAANVAAQAKVMSLAETDAVKAPPMAKVSSDTESVYASWKLSVKGLPEGRSRMQIFADAWNAPLEWLARPTRGDNRVWLMATYTLPSTQAWPAGQAQYNVDNQNVGSGVFTPKGGKATLYFGADPRVSIRTTFDSSKQGETGIINTNKTWSWAWTYTLTNEHDNAIKVRVERPAPMITNEDVTVTYKDKPESIKDDKEHMVYWNEEVPAHGKAVIEHGVTITAPVKLPLFPDVP